ncbi:sulfotransferase family protein [Trinickia symbiotica]|nr:hypothetical protein [Trinickia symbiotica]
MATLLAADDDELQDTLESGIAATRTAPDTATLIVVLGMHRSGTSVIIRAMNTMGAELGDNLGNAVAGENDKGFFEDLDIVDINEGLLAAADAKWHTLAPIDFSRIDLEKLNTLRAKAVSALRAKCCNRIFALKDPRLSRLLPFWQPIFDQLGLRVAYVIAVRNPISVGRSLQKRDRFPLDRSYLLWLNHMVPALKATRDRLRVIVEYDKLIDSPRDELLRIAEHLGLEVDVDRASDFERDFLDKGLQHWRFEASDLEGIHSAPHEVRQLFLALRSTSGSDGEQQPAALDAAVANAQCHLDEAVQAKSRQRANDKFTSVFERLAAPFRAMRRRLCS